jgi:uncharacterized protein (TIGR03382 family)
MTSHLLALALAVSPVAQAAQTLEGDILRVYYDDKGNWISETDEACVQALLDSEWTEFAWWGSPFQRFQLVWTEGGASYAAVADSESTSDMTVVSETDASTTTEMASVHEYTHESITIVKTETWDVTSATMLVHFEVTNDGTDDITDLTLVWEFDPDQDQDESGGGPSMDAGTSSITLTDPTYETNNDVQDPDGDGVSEWVQSVGDESGFAVGFLACAPDSSTLGHYSSWSSDPGEITTLTDFEGVAGDNAMVLQHVESRTIAAGATVVTSLLVSFAETEADALANAQALVDTCETCDTDGDGADNPVCGGDDCDDWDDTVNPSATEVWYDGIDSDCAEDSDYDADADGFDSDAHGGADCDDADVSIYPGATETWYDGVDQDCGGDSDYDADGDGDDSDDHGGADCDDADAEVGPGATEVWYDGVDQDCAEDDDFDADGDGHPIGEGEGQDCDDADEAIHPGATETWYDGVDQDCRGDSDNDADGDGVDSDQHGGEDCDDADATVQSDCGGDDGGGEGGGGDDGGDDTAEDVDEDEDDDDDKTSCSTAPGSGTLALALLGGLALVGVRRRR